jgi:hypothetical protein
MFLNSHIYNEVLAGGRFTNLPPGGKELDDLIFTSPANYYTDPLETVSSDEEHLSAKC